MINIKRKEKIRHLLEQKVPIKQIAELEGIDRKTVRSLRESLGLDIPKPQLVDFLLLRMGSRLPLANSMADICKSCPAFVIYGDVVECRIKSFMDLVCGTDSKDLPCERNSGFRITINDTVIKAYVEKKVKEKLIINSKPPDRLDINLLDNRQLREILKQNFSLEFRYKRNKPNFVYLSEVANKLLKSFNSQSEMADDLSIDRSTISKLIRIIDLPDVIKQAIIEKRLGLPRISRILSKKDEDQQINLLKKYLEE